MLTSKLCVSNTDLHLGDNRLCNLRNSRNKENIMPYIKQDDRMRYELAIKTLVDDLTLVDVGERKGHVNYVISCIVLGSMEPYRYHKISDAIAALRDAADEIARRVMGPREDIAIEENGDLPFYDAHKDSRC